MVLLGILLRRASNILYMDVHFSKKFLVTVPISLENLWGTNSSTPNFQFMAKCPVKDHWSSAYLSKPISDQNIVFDLIYFFLINVGIHKVLFHAKTDQKPYLSPSPSALACKASTRNYLHHIN